MTATYDPIATTTLGSAASTITFSSIPATFTDLRLVLIGVSSSSSFQAYMRFNSDSNNNYSITSLAGDGGIAQGGRGTGLNEIPLNYQFATGNSQPFLMTADVFSYNASVNKSCLVTVQQDRNGSGFVERNVGLWRNTATINSLSIVANTGTMNTGTTATLYGIKAE